jgi:ABC-type transporter Mla MlaB component
VGVCQYDRRRFGDDVLAQVQCAHPVAVETSPDASAVVRDGLRVEEQARTGTTRLALTGDLDRAAAAYVAARLAEQGGESPRLDLARLDFIDVAGCRALVDAAGRLGDGRRLRVEHAPATLRRILTLSGWLRDDDRLVIA